MPHIPGHIESPAQSFGALHSVRSDKTASDFSLLFAPSPFEPIGYKNTNTNKIDIGFLPYLVPWKSGNKKYLVIASDLVPGKIHEEVEEKLKKKINDKRRLSGGKATNISDIEELYENPDEILNVINDKEFSADEKAILKTVHKYLSSSSFKTIYLDKTKIKDSDAVIQWIEENAVPLETIGFQLAENVLEYKPAQKLKRSLMGSLTTIIGWLFFLK